MATKSKQNSVTALNHGGFRPGAGRPRKVNPDTVIDAGEVRSLLATSVPDTVETEAQQHAREALAVLVKRLVSGHHESPRVSAANEILDRGYGSSREGDVCDEVRREARKFCRVAIEVLLRIAEFGASEAASVSAAKSILARGLGPVATAKDVARVLGKRAQAAEDAHTAATGAFATPRPPGARS